MKQHYDMPQALMNQTPLVEDQRHYWNCPQSIYHKMINETHQEGASLVVEEVSLVVEEVSLAVEEVSLVVEASLVEEASMVAEDSPAVEEVLQEEDGAHHQCQYIKETLESWSGNLLMCLMVIERRLNFSSTNGSCIGESTMTIPSCRMHTNKLYFSLHTSSVTFQPSATQGHHIGAMYNIMQMEELPTEADIDYWKYGEDNKDTATVRRMLDLLEDAEELEDAKELEEAKEDLEDGQHLYRMVMGHMDA